MVANLSNEAVVVFLGLLDFVALQVTHRVGRAKLFVIVVDDRLVVHHINLTDEIVFSTNRNQNRPGIRAKLFAHVVHDVVEVGTGAVHLVHEGDARHAILFSLTINCFRLRLHTSHGTKHEDRAVKHTKGTFHFSGEVHVARGVDDVNTDVFHLAQLEDAVFLELLPASRHSSGGDRDTALFFLLHPVRSRSAVMHFADLVDHAGVEQNTLSQGRLTRVNVGADPDITGALKWVFAVGGIGVGHGTKKTKSGREKVE